MKRTISLLLSLVMVLALVPFSAFSVGAESYTDSQGVEYTLSDDGTYYIVSGCDTSVTSVIILKIYTGLPVKKIGDEAFWGCTQLTSIEIPNSVASIGGFAFKNCSNLTNVEIPNSVTDIGAYAFSSCSNLISIEIPNSVTCIRPLAFEYCYCLTDIYCEAESQPEGWVTESNDGWHADWNYGCDATIHWGVKMSGSVEEPETGDINGNGGIDSMDYLYLKRAFFKQYVLSNISVGDINKNGSIDSMDYLYLKRAFFKQYVIE